MPLILLEFFKRNWEAIVIAVIIGGLIFSFHHLRSQRDTAIQELANFKLQMQVLVQEQKAEIARKDKQAETDLTEAQKTHEAQMKAYNLDRDKITVKLKELYETQLNAYRNAHDGMLPPDNTCPLSLPDPSPNTSSPTQSWGIDYRSAYSTLEQACRIETIDYNQLRTWADTACSQVGCSDQEVQP